MTRRVGGEDPLELREAFAALNKVNNSSELAEFLKDRPIVRTPAFMALLRQDYLRFRIERPDVFPAFHAIYSDIFYALHQEAYYEQCRIAINNPSEPVIPSPERLIPAYYARILEILDGNLPPLSGPPANPATDLHRIIADLSAIKGEPVDLPGYTATPGIGWTLLGVTCPRCNLNYPTLRTHMVDLVAAPDLKETFLSEQLDAPGCPGCGEICALPIGVFLEDPPQTGDPLASLSCAWRLEPAFFVYQPPPGTERRAEQDRVLEVRFSLRLDQIGWLEADEDSIKETRATTFSVVYTPDELRELILAPAENEGVPREMSTAIDEIAGKIRTGMLTFHQAEKQIARLYAGFAEQWPLIGAGSPNEAGAQMMEGLVQALLAETLAAGQHSQLVVRTFLAMATATYYIALNETAAAERALARAEDLFAQIPPEDPLREKINIGLEAHRADLLDELGRHEEAEALRKRSETDKLVDMDSFIGRVIAAQRLERMALSSFEQGRLDEALEKYPNCIAELRALAAHIEAADDSETAKMGNSVLHNLSGAIANFGAVIQEVANHIEAATLYHSGASPENIGRELGMNVRVSLRYVDMLRRTLRRYFPDGFSAERLRDEATSLFNEALGIADSTNALDFAAIQAHRLVGLAYKAGDRQKAAEMAERTIQYAQRSGDHIRAGTAKAFLANLKLQEADGKAAIELLESSAVEWMREKVSRGHHVQADPTVVALGRGVLDAVDTGADLTRAVLVLENLKAATTASTLATGFPVQPPEKEGSILAQKVKEAAHNREKLRLDLMWSPNNEELLDDLSRSNQHLLELRQTLSLRDPRFAEWVDATDVQLSGAKAFRKRLGMLGANTRFLGTFATLDSFCTYLIGPQKTLLSSHPQFESRIDDGTDQELLGRLAAYFLEPFADELRQMDPTERLLVSPDVGFFGLPFAALPLEGGPLCTKVTMSFVQGAGVFEAILGRERKSYTRVLAVGGPKRPDWPDLPGAIEEARWILQQFPDPTPPLVGRKATIAALIAALDDFDVIHIACHALPDGPSNEKSRLLLTPDLRKSDSGILSEDRIMTELDLPEGCFVNLAGCSTATQRLESGPLLGGLVPAFLVAGAGSVMSSVLPLADGEATKFQGHFYQYLLSGMSPAGSLAMCQRACVSGELDEEMKNVRAWAYYVIYGAT